MFILLFSRERKSGAFSVYALLEAAFSAHYLVPVVDVKTLGGGCGGKSLAV